MKNPKQAGHRRGQQAKRAAKMKRPHTVGVRLADEELARLKQQKAQDGRDLSEILRDWFIQAPDPQPRPQLLVRRMGAFELANYQRLLALAQGVWNLAEQARRLHLPAVQEQALLALAAIQELASSLVPLPAEEVTNGDWELEEVDDDDGESLFFADLPYWRKPTDEPSALAV